MVQHPLEFDLEEKKHFRGLTSPSATAEWRRLVEKFTSSLPTWAKRRGGSADITAQMLDDAAKGMTVIEIAEKHGLEYQATLKRIRRAQKVARENGVGR